MLKKQIGKQTAMYVNKQNALEFVNNKRYCMKNTYFKKVVSVNKMLYNLSLSFLLQGKTITNIYYCQNTRRRNSSFVFTQPQ